MTLEWTLAVAIVLVLVGLAVIYGKRRRRPDQDAHPAKAAQTSSRAARGKDVALFEEADGSSLLIEPVDGLPDQVEALPSHIATQLVHEAAMAAPHLQRLANGKQELYRVVRMPRGGLQKVAGGGGNVRGFGMDGGRISGQAEFRKVRMGPITPALAVTLASAALGVYWQQQMDATLRGIRARLDGIQSRLDMQQDAKLDLAERALSEHEAAPPEGRYEPPASVSGGLEANLVERRQMTRLLAALNSLDERRMSHREYQAKVLTIDGERLDEHAYRALRGLFVELRVLRLKRLGGLPEPVADQQVAELRNQLGQIEQLLGTALQFNGSRRVEGRRPELPRTREARQRRELEQTYQGRRHLAVLRDAAGQLLQAATPPSPEDEPLELFVGTIDGKPEVYALPPTDSVGP